MILILCVIPTHWLSTTVRDFFQSPKRRDITGARTYVLLSPQVGITGFGKTIFQARLYLIVYITRLIPLLPVIWNRSQEKGIYILGWVTGIVGILILLVGLINFFHFLIGSFLNRTKEYAIMKMLGSDWKRLFCLLLTQSLMIVFASSFLVIWGIELIGDRMDFSLPGLTMTFPPETLLKHILQYIVFLHCFAWQSVCWYPSVFAGLPYRQVSMEVKNVAGKQWGRNFMLGVQFLICWIFVTLTVSLFCNQER